MKMLRKGNWRDIGRVVSELGIARYTVFMVPENAARRAAIQNGLTRLGVPIPRTGEAIGQILPFLSPKPVDPFLPSSGQSFLPLQPLPLGARDRAVLDFVE